MTDKFAEFLKIASQLNKMGIVPLLMGSLGLEQTTDQDWQARDIDIHVHGDERGWEAPDEERIYDMDKIEPMMERLGYRLVDLHEHEFQKAFSRLMKGKTVLMIAHRLTSIRKVDEILVLDNGTVIERGTDEFLMGRDSKYRELQQLYGRANEWRVK